MMPRILATLAALAVSASAAPAQFDLELGATLLGANEVPPLTSRGVGWAKATYDSRSTTLTIFLSTNLDAAGVALREGGTGVTGPVVGPLSALGNGQWTGLVRLTKLQETLLFNGRLYLEASTTAQPTGEIRGQLLLPSMRAFEASLDASQVIPPSNSTVTAEATGSLSLPNHTFTYELIVRSGQGNDVVHLKAGKPNQNGRFIANLGAVGSGNIQGSITLSESDAAEFDDFYLEVTSGQNRLARGAIDELEDVVVIIEDNGNPIAKGRVRLDREDNEIRIDVASLRNGVLHLTKNPTGPSLVQANPTAPGKYQLRMPLSVQAIDSLATQPTFAQIRGTTTSTGGVFPMPDSVATGQGDDTLVNQTGLPRLPSLAGEAVVQSGLEQAELQAYNLPSNWVGVLALGIPGPPVAFGRGNYGFLDPFGPFVPIALTTDSTGSATFRAPLGFNDPSFGVAAQVISATKNLSELILTNLLLLPIL